MVAGHLPGGNIALLISFRGFLMAKHSPAFLQLVESVRGSVREATVHEVRDMQLGGVAFELIDVREDHEWSASHIVGARHIGRGVIERDIETLIPKKDELIVLYCGGGFRSILSAVNLKQMGYSNLISMDGGFRDWRNADFPIETDSK
jgi:rhodanese-related sulfurtransferase